MTQYGERNYSSTRHYGILLKITRMLKYLYEGVCSNVKYNGELRDWFQLETGSLLSPVLYVFKDQLTSTVREGDLHGMTVGEVIVVQHLDFADDIALLAGTFKTVTYRVNG